MATVHTVSTPAAANRIKVHIVKIPVASASTSDTLVKEIRLWRTKKKTLNKIGQNWIIFGEEMKKRKFYLHAFQSVATFGWLVDLFHQ